MQTQEQHADATAQRVAVVLALYKAGQIERPQFVETFAQVVYAASVVAAQLAEALLFRLYGWVPLGIAPGPKALEALQKAAETITAEMPEDVPEDVPEGQQGGRATFWQGVETSAQRVADDAPKATARQTKQSRMRAAGVTFWIWVSEVDACDECKAKDGQVFAMSVRFVRPHPRCACDLDPAKGPEARQPLGFEFLTPDQLQKQRDTLAALPETEYRTKALERVRKRLAELGEDAP